MEILKKINLRIESLEVEVIELGLITNHNNISGDFTFWNNRVKRFNIILNEIDRLKKLKEDIKIFMEEV